MPHTHPKIAIIGAGPGGLTLASILQKHTIPFTVYEGDASPSERNQGGTLDLHPQGGQAALREAGLWEEFAKRARPESDVLKIVRQGDGAVLWDGNGADKREVKREEAFEHRPEIDRRELRALLLAAVREGSIKWGRKVVNIVEGKEKGQWDLHFSDGSIEEAFDLVVGADGAWSKVRPLLTPTKPFYSGITAIELWALNVETAHPWISSYVGAGNCFSFGDGRTIQAQRIGDGSIRTYGCLRRPETFVQDCGIDWSRPDEARREYVERYFGDCGEDLKRLLLESTEELIPRPLYMLPVGVHWEARAGLTLLGDSAHLMTPFAGVGVNAAMMDALELARAIINVSKSNEGGEGESLSTAIAEYEKGLFVRGARFAQKTVDNMEKHFSAGGNEALVKRLRAAYGRK